MAIIYIQGSGEEFAVAETVVDEDSDSWWAGAQQCFVAVAIAAVLVGTALSTQVGAQVAQDREELSAGSLFGQADEDFWQNPVAPVQASLYQRLPLGDVEELPAGSLFGQFDEDFWLNPVRPVPATLFRHVSPFTERDATPSWAYAKLTQEPVEVLTGSSGNVLLTQESVEVVTGSSGHVDLTQLGVEVVTGSSGKVDLTQFAVEVITDYPRIDELYWQNRVQPIAASLYRSPLFRDPEEIPAASLFVPPIQDEDYWINPVRPVAASMYVRLPILPDVEEIPSGYLFLYTAKLTQMAVEIITSYDRQVYTGWTGTSMCVN